MDLTTDRKTGKIGAVRSVPVLDFERMRDTNADATFRAAVRRELMDHLSEVLADSRAYVVRIGAVYRHEEGERPPALPATVEYRIDGTVLLDRPTEAEVGDLVRPEAFPGWNETEVVGGMEFLARRRAGFLVAWERVR